MAVLIASGLSASTAAAASELAIEPEAVDFGVLVPGRDASRSFTVRNLGPDPVAFSDIYLVGDVDPFYFLGGTCPETGTFEGECQLTIEFAPETSGDFEALLVVEGGPDDEPAVASLTAKSRPPGQLVVSPNPVDFGAVPVGVTSAVQPVRIHNNGGSAIAIGRIWANGMYVVTSDGCGREVAPLSTCEVGVAYQPFRGSVIRERATQLGTLAISAEAWDQMPPRSLNLTVPLSGTALMSSGKPYPSRLELPGVIREKLAHLATAATRLIRKGPKGRLELPLFDGAPYGLLGVRMRARVGKQWVPLANPTATVQPYDGVSLRFWLTKADRRILKSTKTPIRVEALARFRAGDRSVVEAATTSMTIRPMKKPAKKRKRR